MLHTIRPPALLNLRRLVQKTYSIQRSTHTTQNDHVNSCLCGNVYVRRRDVFYRHLRVHSTSSDQHRQKAVIETSTPKIVIDKLEDAKGNIVGSSEEEISRLELLRGRLDPYVKLARWDKPIGIYLLYWPCTWSIALASLPGNLTPWDTLSTAGLFLAGAGLMRGAGCTINDLWDKDIDAQVERTKERPLVSGAVSKGQAVGFLAGQLTLALGILLQLNCYSVLLGASSMVLVIAYPLAKRFTNYPQLFLGATFNWGALLGYSALQGQLAPAVCVPLYIGALAWTVIYDTIYAHQDKVDDARIGMKSTALTFGPHTKPALAVAMCSSVYCWAQAGTAAGLDWPYYAALVAYSAHVGKQIYTLNADSPDDCAQKFKSNSLVGLIILIGMLTGGYSQYVENRRKFRGQEDSTITKSCLFG